MSAVVLRGDAAHLPLPDGSVDLIVTSPPYWSLRVYTDGGENLTGQIGNEETWQEYLEALLTCTQEWVRVLKPEGSIFVDLGDKYANDAKWGGATSGKHVAGLHGKTGIGRAKSRTGIPAKSLMLLPERYRIGCVDQLGLIAREVIEWHKPNPLPESVRDRCGRTHEDVVHLVKQPRYFAALDEIRESHTEVTRTCRDSRRGYSNGGRSHRASGTDPEEFNPLGKVPGSVWTIQSQPLVVPAHLGEDHFAAFPMELPRRIILGWSPSGICLECSEGRRPVATVANVEDRKGRKQRIVDFALDAAHGPDGRGGERWRQTVRITGYACACPDASAPTRPAVIADPFGGTGTTAMTASVLGRIGITFDRSMSYCRLARWRTRDPGERARALGVPKPPPVPRDRAACSTRLLDPATSRPGNARQP